MGRVGREARNEVSQKKKIYLGLSLGEWEARARQAFGRPHNPRDANKFVDILDGSPVSRRRHDPSRNDTRLSDTLPIGFIATLGIDDTQHNVNLSVAFFLAMPSGVMLSVVWLNVVAPSCLIRRKSVRESRERSTSVATDHLGPVL